MYFVTHTRPAPAPLDFDMPRRTDSVADALGPDACPHGEFSVPSLDTASLLTEVGLSGPAVREVLTGSFDPGI